MLVGSGFRALGSLVRSYARRRRRQADNPRTIRRISTSFASPLIQMVLRWPRSKTFQWTFLPHFLPDSALFCTLGLTCRPTFSLFCWVRSPPGFSSHKNLNDDRTRPRDAHLFGHSAVLRPRPRTRTVALSPFSSPPAFPGSCEKTYRLDTARAADAHPPSGPPSVAVRGLVRTHACITTRGSPFLITAPPLTARDRKSVV